MNARTILHTLLGVISLLLVSMIVCYLIISSDSNITNYEFQYQKSLNDVAKTEAILKIKNSMAVTEANKIANAKANDPTLLENTSTTQASVKVIDNRKTKMITDHSTKAADSTRTTTTTAAAKKIYRKFAICHSYWEQQTNAVLNMWSFQKWANKSGDFGVLEPFVHDSVLEFSYQNMFQHNFNTSLRFRDYFDLDQWNKGTEKYKIPPLVNWREFVEHANRSIHLAICVYKEPRGTFEGDAVKNNPACASELQRFRSVVEKLLGFLGFKIEKVVCYSLLKYYNSLEEFNSPFDPNSNATIYFTEWTGIGRIGIGDETLQREHEPDILTSLLPSARILSDSRSYVKRVLNVDFQGYTAIVFRSVRRLQEMEANGFNHAEVIEHYYGCISQLPYILDHVGRKSFLATDLGRFGDQANVNARSPEFMKMFQHLISRVYGNKTISEYEEHFITAANGIADTGYIGTIQKAISLNAKCVIVIGGFSTFQDSLIAEFKKHSHCITELCYGQPFPPKKSTTPK